MFWPLQRRMLDADRDVPMVYSLTWDGVVCAFVFTVARGAFEFLRRSLAIESHVKNLQSGNTWPESSSITSVFELPSSPNRSWGFPDLAEPIDEPYIMVADPKISSSGDPSWRIRMDAGADLVSNLRWDRMWAISATLKLAFGTLNRFDGETRSEQKQGVALDLVVRPNSNNGGSIEAVLGQELMRFLAQDNPGLAPSVATAIGDTYQLLTQPVMGKTEFPVTIADGSPKFESPTGSGASLQRSGGNPRVLITHNCDGPGKQLPFLAGLAALVTACRPASTANGSP